MNLSNIKFFPLLVFFIINSLQSQSTVDQALKGRVAGLSIFSVSGAPGTPSEIRIRGAGSFLSNNSPLIVIDGVPYENYAIGENDKFPGLDLLSLINTMDIHSVTVLKDASDVAPYGVKGTNGVIVINTKRAIEGQTLRDLLEELNLID